jgi:hypothetical protein
MRHVREGLVMQLHEANGIDAAGDGGQGERSDQNPCGNGL